MRCSQCFIHTLMDVGSSIGAMLGTILNYKTDHMSTAKSPLIRLILTDPRP